MSKPEWSRAPDWANVLLKQNGFTGILYCWASAHEDKAKAIWNDDLARSWMYFALKANNWDYVEPRP
jgi:hypothetical protein